MAWLRKRGRRTVGLVAAAPALTACGQAGPDDGNSGNSGSSGDREAKYKRVIEDPHPRPADVIEAAGAPTGVVRADDGTLLLTYDAGNVEDDEGPAATAWRIVGPDGRTVAEHAEHADAEAARAAFKGVRGGFVRVPPGEGAKGAYALDDAASGTRSSPPRPRCAPAPATSCSPNRSRPRHAHCGAPGRSAGRRARPAPEKNVGRG
ncbi:hypothetical protein ACFU53_26900 [Streptomyces sp. NPDC057474]|uniref:hypothetical protein n=1 Tax=Streptomyces sp. NPDC057474 TaxID=3346144 RepID=UPI00367DF08B